jgi:hypothetical protein
MEIKAIADLKQRLVDLKAMLPEITIEIARRNEAGAIDLITQEQLAMGVDSDDKLISPKYTPFTVRVKKSKGQEYRFPTLHDEGDFYKSIKLKFGTATTPWLFVVYATDWKTRKLQTKYGPEILGLSPSSVDKFNDLIKDELIGEIQKHI